MNAETGQARTEEGEGGSVSFAVLFFVECGVARRAEEEEEVEREGRRN